MNTEEILLMQTLKLKQLNTRGYTGEIDLIERALDSNPEEAKTLVRNLCGHVPIAMFDEVSDICNLLDLSKREVVEMAISDFLAKARETIDKVQPFVESSTLSVEVKPC